MALLYDEGVENVDFVAGFSETTGSQSKESDHLLAEATRSTIQMGSAVRTWVTDDPIDLTGIDSLVVDWSHAVGGSGTREAVFIASTDKTGGTTTFDARLLFTSAFARRENVLDVSALSGNHFIRVHARVNQPSALDSATSTVRVFRVRIPITAHPLTSDALSAQSSSSFDTASITRTAKRLVVVTVASFRLSGTPNFADIAGFVRIGERTDNDGNRAHSVLVGMVDTDATGSLTITFDGQIQQGISWAITEFGGVQPGANGANAWRNLGDNVGSGTSQSVTLAAFDSPWHATFSSFAQVSSLSYANPSSGFTQLFQPPGTTGSRRNITQWGGSVTNPISITGQNVPWSAIAFEVVAGTVEPPPEPPNQGQAALLIARL